MRASIVGSLIGALTLGAAGALHAQDPIPVRPPDTLLVDSLRPHKDTLSTTDRLLQAQKQQRVQLQPLPLVGTSNLQPYGGRMVFNRDSIDWAAAEDVAEILARVPGVYLERADWLVAPQLPNYLGRGAGAIEYVLDGVPELPLGVDSLAYDPSLMPLTFLDRVEVEQAPGMLRVFLYTRRADRNAPRTKICASQGDRGVSRYCATFERRYTNGIGLALGADYVGINPNGTGSGGGNVPTGWVQFGYAPSPRLGFQGQLITQRITRNFMISGDTQDTLMRQEDGSRTDAQLRFSWRAHAGDNGASANLFLAHTAWSSDSAPGNEAITELGGVFATREPTWSAQLSSFHYSRWTSLDVRADFGWAPTDWLSGSLQAVAQRHDGDRRGQWVTGRLGIRLPWGFHVGGSVSNGHRVQAPALLDDPVLQFTDAELTGGFASRLLTLDGGFTRNDDWAPRAFPEFLAVPSYAPMPLTDWITGHVRLAPLGWLAFESTFEHPAGGALPDGTPPMHALSTVTLRSHFQRNFPSGIFELKLQGVLESWGQGIGGRDLNGAPLVLPAANMFRTIIQFQLGPFIAYYDRINLKAVRTGSVPGYPIQPLGSSFGIRWEFTN